MKVTDFAEIEAAALQYLADNGSGLQDVFDDDEIIQMVADAYHYNDAATEVTWRLQGKPTIIITTYRVSVIYDGVSSYYKSKLPLCVYESLEEDIECLFVTIDAAWLRYQSLTA